MFRQPWLPRNTCALLEEELTRAFQDALSEGPSGRDTHIDRHVFELVRNEIGMYYQCDLLGALPYVLIGFLRFGINSVDDDVALDYVIQFLNIRLRPYVDARDDAAQFDMRLISQGREEAVSCFSSEQCSAVLEWLKAIQQTGRFYADDPVHEDLKYATEYWAKRVE